MRPPTLSLLGVALCLQAACGGSNDVLPATPAAATPLTIASASPSPSVPEPNIPAPVAPATSTPEPPPAVVATSSDGSVKLLRKGLTLTLVRNGSESPLPSDWTQGAGDGSGIAVSQDGTLLGVFDGARNYSVYDLTTMKLKAVRSPKAQVAGGTVGVGFASPTSLEWTFSRANCELQDIESGKAKCGTCSNAAFASFSVGLAGVRVKDPLEIKRDCVK